MKFTCPKSELQAAVSIATRAIPSSSVEAALLNVLLSLNKSGELTMMSTNNRIVIKHTMKVSDSAPGKVALLGGHLNEILAGIQTSRAADVTVSIDDKNSATLKSADAEYEMPGFSGESFPLVAEMTDGVEFSIPSALLKDLIRKTIVVAPLVAAVGSGSGVNKHEEVFAEGSKGELVFVATDSVRLAIRTVAVADLPNFKCLIPSAALSDLNRTLKPDVDTSIVVTQDRASFSFGNTEMRVRLTDKVFPDFRTIIPKTQSRNVVVRTREFHDALKGCVPMSGEARQVVVEFQQDRMILTCSSPDFGKARREVAAGLTGEPVTLRFNGRYLLDFTGAVDSESFRWGVSSPSYPTLMKPDAEDPGYDYIVMPLQDYGKR